MSSPYAKLGNRTLDQYKVIELREELKKRNLTTKGLKKELLKRLDEAIRIEQGTEKENTENDSGNANESKIPSEQPTAEPTQKGMIGVTGDDSFQDDLCVLCREPFHHFAPPCITSCKHGYHYRCIMKWSQTKRRCPVCPERLESLSCKDKQLASSAMEKFKVEDNGRVALLPTVLFCGTDRRDVIEIIEHPIGKSNKGMVCVYRAICTSSSILEEDTKPIVSVVAVKCVSRKYQPQTARTLKRDVCRNKLIPYHRNILGIIRDFDYKCYYCVVFPLMENSLRSIMRARFPNGVPEECIVFVLKEILTAMSFIYWNGGDTDLQVNAGNIFFSGSEIKLACSASVYQCEDQHDFSSSSYLPMDSISEGGVAPEYPSYEGSYASNIWMVGITALELAYGGIWVSSKADLEYKLGRIEKNGELPGDWKQETWKKMLMSFLYKERRFSRAFEKMVISCLSYWHDDRPDIQQLRECEVFSKCEMDMNCFSRLFGEQPNAI